MPLYEYECNVCRERFERRQKVTDEPVSVCPSCGGAVRRVIHPVGIIFKGSGFYVTDNRKGNTVSSSPSDSAPSDKTGEKKAGDAAASGEAKASTGDGATKSESSSSGSESSKSTDSSSPKAPASTGT